MTEQTTTMVAPFTRLTTNIKVSADDALGPITAFVGENRTGKTARLDAIRLALTGRHPVGPHGTDLFELPVAGATMVYAELHGPSGNARFLLEKGRKPERPERTGLLENLGEHALPIQSMHDLITLGTARSREAIFRRFGNISEIPTPRGLSDSQLVMWQHGLSSVRTLNPEADTATVLSALAAWLRQKKLALGREVKALDKLILDRQEDAASRLAGVEELPGLRAELVAAEKYEQTAAIRLRRQALMDEIAVLGRESSVAEPAPFDAAPLLAEYEHREKAYADAKAHLEEETRRLNGGEFLLDCIAHGRRKLASGDAVSCILCGSDGWDPEATLREVEPRVEARRKSHAQAAEAVKAALAALKGQEQILHDARNAAQTVVMQHKFRQKQTETRLAQLGRELREVEATLEGAPLAYAGPSSEAIRARIKLLESKEQAARQFDHDTAKLRNLQVEQDIAQTLEQEASKILDELLRTTVERAHLIVNTYMPETFEARIDLENARWQVIGKDAAPHSRYVMSGSERAALTIALSLGWTEDSPARYAIFDDEDLAAFSSTNLRRLCEMLRNAVEEGSLTQVFIATSRGDELPGYVTKISTEAPAPVAALPTPSWGPPTLML